MDMHLSTVLGLGIVIVLAVGLALWYFSSATRENEKRREAVKTRRMAHQPWDSAGGRANR